MTTFASIRNTTRTAIRRMPRIEVRIVRPKPKPEPKLWKQLLALAFGVAGGTAIAYAAAAWAISLV